MKTIQFFTVLFSSLCTLIFYSVINYMIFGDFGLDAAGRIVFASIYGYFDYLLLPLAIFIGMYALSVRYPEMSRFKSLVRFGTRTTLIAAGIFSAFIFMCLELNDDYFSNLIQLIRSTEISGSGPTAFERHMLNSAQAIEQTSLLRSASFYSIGNFAVYTFLGLLSTYVSAAIEQENREDSVLSIVNETP